MANLISGWTIKSIEDGAEGGDLTEEFACINPASLRKQLGGAAKISSVFVDRANSYYCPWGYPYGQAWLLIDGKTLRQLKMNKRQAVRCYISEADASGSPVDVPSNKRSQNRELTFNSLYIQRAICICTTPNLEVPSSSTTYANLFTGKTQTIYSQLSVSARKDSDIYLLELVDIRYLYRKFTSVNKCYNLVSHAHLPTGVGFTSDEGNFPDDASQSVFHLKTLRYHTMTGQYIVYKQATIVQDIWENISTELTHGQASPYLASFKAAGSTLSGAFYNSISSTQSAGGTPLNVQYRGVSCWDAMNDMLQYYQRIPQFNPTTGEVNVQTLGETGSEIILTEKGVEELNAQLLFDYRVISNPCLLFPESVNIVRYVEPHNPNLRFTMENFPGLEDFRVYAIDKVQSIDLSDYSASNFMEDQAIPGTKESFFADETYYTGNFTSGDSDDLASEGYASTFSPHGYLNVSAGSPVSNTFFQNSGGTVNSDSPFDYRNLIRGSGKLIYAGIAWQTYANSARPILPSPVTGNFTWRDYGDGLGLVTEIFQPETLNTTSPQKSSAIDTLDRVIAGKDSSERISVGVPVCSQFPVRESASHISRRHVFEDHFPKTATVMACQVIPPTNSNLGSYGTVTGTQRSHGGHYTGIILYPKHGGYLDTRNMSNKPFGDNLGPICGIRDYARLDKPSTEGLFSSGSYADSSLLRYPPVWHGRTFTGVYEGTSEAGYPIYGIRSTFPILMIELNSDLTCYEGLPSDSSDITLELNGQIWSGQIRAKFPSLIPNDYRSSGSSPVDEFYYPAARYWALIAAGGDSDLMYGGGVDAGGGIGGETWEITAYVLSADVKRR